MRSLRVALTILALPVGILAGDGYDWATNPDRVWTREAAVVATIAAAIVELSELRDIAAVTRAELYAIQIQAAIDPPGTRFVIPIAPKQEPK